MAFVEADTLDDDFILAREGAQNNAGLALVLARNYFYLVSFFNFHMNFLIHPERSGGLDDLGRERHNRVPTALRELARYGPEDAIPLRRNLLALLLDDHDCILVEADVGAVFAREGFGLSHHYRAVNILLLHELTRLGGLDGDHYNI